MVSPDSDSRYHPHPESLPPINGDFTGKDIVSLTQFDRTSIEILFSEAAKMEANLNKGTVPQVLNGKAMFSCFSEASTRTRLSFESAHLRLGGDQPLQGPNLPRLEDPYFDYDVSSLTYYPDVIVLRHPESGSSLRASEAIRESGGRVVPVINAGDGINEHPTQAMLDMYTIMKRLGRLNNLKGVISGDPRNQRAVHSLLNALAMYEGNQVYLLSPSELSLPSEKIADLRSKGLFVKEIKSGRQIPRGADFWYWTRIMRERFDSEEEYEAAKAKEQRLTARLIETRGREDLFIMHVGPVTDEVDQKVHDNEPRFIPFEQVRNGLYVRMALLALVLGKVK